MLHQFLLVWVSARLVRHTYLELHFLTSFERHASIFHPSKNHHRTEYYRVNSIAIGWLLHKVAVLNYCTPTVSEWITRIALPPPIVSLRNISVATCRHPASFIRLGSFWSISVILASSTATPSVAGYWAIANCIKLNCECMRYHMTVISDHTVNQNRFSLVVVIISPLLMLYCCSAPCRIGPRDGWCHWITHQCIQRDQQNRKSDPPRVHLGEYTWDGLLLLCCVIACVGVSDVYVKAVLNDGFFCQSLS
jgi:hypothetical protein